MKPSVSIFFPYLNDWGTVGSMVTLAIATVSRYTDDWEVLLIDDGSSKESSTALKSIVKEIYTKYDIRNTRKTIRIIHHEKNRGYGGALRSGFAGAKKDLIFYTDCDAQYDPQELSKLLTKMKPDIGMVNGYKRKRHDPFHRIIIGSLYHHVVKYMFGLPLRDTDCDFRLIRRRVFDKVKLFENTGTICVELVKKVHVHGFPIVEVPVHHYFRTSGKSQFFNIKRLYHTGVNLGKLWWKLIVQKEYFR